jgi:putative protease
MTNKIEIMAPVGSYESLASAIKAGANSVYFGIEQLNMRSRSANNFTIEDLKKIVSIAKKAGVKTYLTVNTIIYNDDIKLMKQILDAAKKTGITAIIACDIAVINYANEINLEVHMSTQTNISNIEAVKFYSKYADVVVLARELTLDQIKNICDEIKKQKITGPSGKLVEIEIFVHGALCVSISGKCYMSLALYNSSANRGACYQTCRRKYRVMDDETGDELVVDNKYIMSPKDLCTIQYIDKLIESGVSVFKIEGRGRSPDYVYAVVKAYKEAVEAVENKTFTENKIKKWEQELATVFNRGFWKGGYYLGNKLGEWAGTYGSKATKEKHFVGLVKHYYPKAKIAEIEMQKESLTTSNEIIITGNTTGVIKGKVESIYINEKPAKTCTKKDKDVTIQVKEKVRKGDKIYVVINRKELQGE